MTSQEAGFLLLTSHLGNPRRPVLTLPQLRQVADAVQQAQRTELDRDMTHSDLLALGLSPELAERILVLMDDTALLEQYLQRGNSQGIQPVTRVSPDYPQRLRQRLKMDAPGCLWAKGDLSLLKKPAVALVGSRDLFAENARFAREVGKQAALQGLVLVSGNARGADTLAQDSCLEHGGSVISIVPDKLTRLPGRASVLYLSEDGFDRSFSSQRALSRNRIIHALGSICFVAQCAPGYGGTWSGARHNLQHRLSALFCCADGSAGMQELEALGAQPVSTQQLQAMGELFKISLYFD